MAEVKLSPFFFLHQASIETMKAMLFAAGMGTRLKPLTDHLPKALVPVAGVPLLDLTLQKLRLAGTAEVVVNVHHFARQIIDYLQEKDFGMQVQISDESNELLDTGGGLRHAIPLFGKTESPVLIHNVDILSDADLSAFHDFSKKHDIALLVSERETNRYLLFNDEMRLMGWTNIKTGEVRSPYPDLNIAACKRYAFSGIHAVSPGVFPLLEEREEKFPIMDFYLSECHRLDIRGYFAKDLQLVDVGKLDTLAVAEDFAKGHHLLPIS